MAHSGLGAIDRHAQRGVKTLFWVTPTLQLYDLFWALHNMGPGADPAEIVAVSAAHAIDFLPPEDSGAGQ